MYKKDRADKLGNDDTSTEDQRPIKEVSSFNEHTVVTGSDLTASYCRHIIKFKGFKM